MTPLHEASLNGHDVIVEVLLKHQANPDVVAKVRDENNMLF